MEKTRILQPNKPHFFKLVLSISEPQLSVPLSFIGSMKGEKPKDEATLRSDNIPGKSWPVKVLDGRIFQDGWEDFAKAHKLSVGDFLVFRHEGGWVFHVLVFDSTSCQKEFPVHLQSEEPKCKHNKRAPCLTVKLNPNHFKKTVLHIPAIFARSNNLRNMNRAITLTNNRQRSWQVNLRYNDCQTYIAGGLRTFLEDNKLNVGDSCNFKLVSNGNNVVFKVTSSGSNRDSVEEEAAAPYFSTQIKPRHFRSNVLRIPAKFARLNNLTYTSCPVTFLDKRGTKWTINLRHSKWDHQAYIAGGWPRFLQDNRLKVGDFCMFKLVSTGKKVTFEVTISYSSGVGASSNDIELIRNTKEEEEAPYFCKEIRPHHFDSTVLLVPAAFARSHSLGDISCTVTFMDERKRSWHVNLRHTKEGNASRVYFAGGWGKFLEDKQLKVGDICSFKLISTGKNVVFKVASL